MDRPRVSSSTGSSMKGNSTVSYRLVHLVLRIFRLSIRRLILLLRYMGSQKRRIVGRVHLSTWKPKTAYMMGDMM